jgi:voltage-gated sodium channel
VNLIEQAFTGEHMHLQISSHKIDWNDLVTVYKYVSDMTQLFVMSNLFTNFVTFVIIIAGVLVGLETYDPQPQIRVWMTLADEVVFWVFMLEMVLKIIAEEFYPINPWISSVAVSPAGTGWNIFDGIVVLGSAGTKWSSGTGDSQSLVMMLRLLKLLRVLKLMRALPQLQVIVEALGKGMSSIGFVGLILCIFFYFSGILAMLLFKDNDPWHFGTLHMTVVSLFQCATLDDWTPILYINMFGCETNGYDDFDELGPQHCDPEKGGAQPWVAALFFVWFILVGGLVLLTLFIGVVSMGMDEAEMEQKEQKKVDERVTKIVSHEGLEQLEVTLYREVFECVDFTHSNKIGKDELRFGMTIANMTLTDDEFDGLFAKVDKDKSEAIDFAEFLEFMFDLKDQLNQWPEERKNQIGLKKRKKKEAFNFLGGKQGGSKIVPVKGSAEGGNDSDEMSDISGVLDTQPEMIRTLTTHTPTLPPYRENDVPSIDVDHPDMYIMTSESGKPQGGPDLSSLQMMPMSPSYDSQEDERPRKSQRSQRRRASREAMDGMVAVSPEEHANHTRETAQHKHQIMELQGQIQQLHSLLTAQHGGRAPGSPSNNHNYMGEMGSPLSQNLMPSAVVAQQSHSMAQMQQVITQQADQMKLMMEMHNTHINTTTALLAERAQTAGSPDSYYGDGWAGGRPGTTGLPGTAGQTSPLKGAGMNVMGRNSASGGSAFTQGGGGFGSSGGRQLESDGRSPPSLARDSLSAMMQSPSPSRMPNKTYTPSTDGSRPSPSKKPTKSTVVSI